MSRPVDVRLTLSFFPSHPPRRTLFESAIRSLQGGCSRIRRCGYLIQMVLRRADVQTTRDSTSGPPNHARKPAMREFASVLKKQYGISKKKKGL
jgi:hypothetical protein